MTRTWFRFSIAVVLAVGALSSCSSDDPTAAPDVGADVEDGSSTGLLLDGAEIEVVNAVAPFDHESNVDSLLLEMRLSLARSEQVNECVRSEGFTPPPLPALPDRGDPSLNATASFPNYEVLARDGLPSNASSAGGGGDEPTTWEPEPGSEDAIRSCSEKVDAESGGVLAEALDLWAATRSAWEDVLGEIETLDEVVALREEFGDCLRADGIPAQATSTEEDFLFYVDGLISAAADQAEVTAILDRSGKLYAECGRDLFEAQRRLRSGERRAAFVADHDDAIRAISAALFGSGVGE